MHNLNAISIDEAKFLKTSKKLLSHLTEEYSLDIKLSKIQEILAQSLGYRNLYDLQKTLTNSSENIKVNNLPYSNVQVDIFRDIAVEQATEILVNLMEHSSTDMWRGRAISLIFTVMNSLIHLREIKEVVINSNIIREYLVLDNMIRLFKRKDLPLNIKKGLKDYLFSLPGYQDAAPKQNDVVLEQHGYLVMQFHHVLTKLQQIEENDFIIADKSWFSMETDSKVISASGGSNRKTIYEKEYFDRLTVNPKLSECEFLEDSWISMPEYENWITPLFKKEQLNNIRISNLLIYVTTIISPSKRNELYLVLNSILNNYYIASSISNKIFRKINK